MNITTSLVSKIRISGIEHQDPIEVIFEDLGKGQGQIFINQYGQCWSHYWGTMGDCCIREFFLSCDKYYLTKKLIPYNRMTQDDFEGTIQNIKEHILEYRREDSYSSEKARELWDSLELCSNIYEIKESAIGDISDWYEFIEKKPTIECENLRDRIIPTIKKALRKQNI